MPAVPLRVARAAAEAELSEALAALRTELELPSGFPADVEAEAVRAVERYELPDEDLTALAFVTIDPAGATDLDQALAIERDGAGWRVFYAIADLAAFVEPDGAIDAEARRRGVTLYAADGRIPLHPPAISEDAASLLPGELRGAHVWEFALDASGRATSTRVRRARVRSRRQWSYEDAQDALDREPPLGMLRDVGEARLALETERGGASLAIPEILVERDERGYRLESRTLSPVESWNAQLSLLTGMEAARLMLEGGVGILRTMPAAEPDATAGSARRRARSAPRGARTSATATTCADSPSTTRGSSPSATPPPRSSVARPTGRSTARPRRRRCKPPSARPTRT